MVYRNLDKVVTRSLVRVPGSGTDVSPSNFLMDLSSTSTVAASAQVSPVDWSQFLSQTTQHQTQATQPTPDVEAAKKKLKPDTPEQVYLELPLEQQNLKPLQQIAQPFIQQHESQQRRMWEQVSVLCQTTAGQEWKQIIVPVATGAAQQPQLQQQLGLLAGQLIQPNATPLKQMSKQAVKHQEHQQQKSPKWQVVLAPVTTTAGPQWRLVYMQQNRNAAIPCVLV